MTISCPMIRRLLPVTAVCGALGLASCGGPTALEDAADVVSSEVSHSIEYGARTRARLINSESSRIGEIKAWQGQHGVVIEIDVKKLPPGGHGLHIHSRGDCSDPAEFKASAGHVTKDERPHGFLNPGGHHAGDLPNIYVHADGTARLDLFSRDISLTDLMDADGAAIIIHESRDDYQTQPIGHAGARLACAAFTPRSF